MRLLRGRDCKSDGHSWGKWHRIGIAFQTRSCKACGWEESAPIPCDEARKDVDGKASRVFDARDEEAIQLLKTDPDKFFQQHRNPWSLRNQGG